MAMASVDEECLPDAIIAQIPRDAEKGNGGDRRPRNENFKLESLDLELLASETPRELDCEER